MKKNLLILSLVFLFLPFCHAQEKVSSFDLAKLAKENGLTAFNRSFDVIRENNYNGIRVSEKDNYGLIWLSSLNFKSGRIEFDVRGKDVDQQSFLGMAFEGVNDSIFEAIYFRPFNFRSADPVKRSHSVQYVSMPAFDWYKLREEFPGKYENAVDPVPDPNQWFHVLIILTSPTVMVSVGGSKEVSLAVHQLNKIKAGKIGFFVGNGSGGDFANLKITTLH